MSPRPIDGAAPIEAGVAGAASPVRPLRELRIAGAWVALLPVRFDAQRWLREFLAQWPVGSPAWASYFERITRGPAFSPAQAVGR